MNQSAAAQISIDKSCLAIEYHLSVWYWYTETKWMTKIQILKHTLLSLLLVLHSGLKFE